MSIRRRVLSGYLAISLLLMVWSGIELFGVAREFEKVSEEERIGLMVAREIGWLRQRLDFLPKYLDIAQPLIDPGMAEVVNKELEFDRDAYRRLKNLLQSQAGTEYPECPHLDALLGAAAPFLSGGDKTASGAPGLTAADQLTPADQLPPAPARKAGPAVRGAGRPGDPAKEALKKEFQRIRGLVDENLAPARDEVEHLRNFVIEWLDAQKAAAARRAKVNAIVLTGLLSLIILISLVVGLAAFRGMGKRLRRLLEATEKIKVGDFNIDLPASVKDEISSLSAAFNTMSAELARAKKRESDFLAIAAHELKTPLAQIKGAAENIETALSAGEAERIAADMARIKRELDNLRARVHNLRDLGLIEAREFRLEKGEIMTRGFLHRIADGFRPIAARKQVALEIRIEADVPGRFVADEGRMVQVLGNLLDNAIRYTPGGGRVELCARLAGDYSVQFEVSDTGPGIPPDKLPTVFDKYARIETSHRSGAWGTGLGLAVAKGIVVAHGGSIEARSKLGGGSCFVVRLTLPSPALSAEEVA